jgi:Tol biopolymer transport system component
MAFDSMRDGNVEVYVMDTNGSNQINITDNRAEDAFPVWSPDGEKIAFESNRDGNWEVYATDTNGSNQACLTTNSAIDGNPVWSPDGERIAFVSDRDGKFEIYVMDADGANQTRLTTNNAYDGNPVWSPDGKKIAYTKYSAYECEGCVGESEIYVMDADGSNQINLSNSPAKFDVDFSWSPDGQKVAFTTVRDDPYETNDYNEIYITDVDGTNLMRLTTTSRANDMEPAWSPNGEKIAFSSDRDGNDEIYVIDADRHD